METAGCFHDTLAAITWDRIAVFLPNLYQDMVPPQINTPSEPTPTVETIDENSLKNENEIKREPTVVSDTQLPNPNIQTIGPNIPEVIQPFRGPIATPVVGNSTFIDMEEGIKPSLTGVVPQPLPSYHPMPSYPGSIEPFVPMPQTMATIIPKDTNSVPNAQMSAYPWPAPSDQKNF
jgi:hypothetical protein